MTPCAIGRLRHECRRALTGWSAACSATWKPGGEGVWELRIDRGPGYRVYCGCVGERIVVLLHGGDKRKQDADIKKAKEYWHDYQQRTKTQGTRSR